MPQMSQMNWLILMFYFLMLIYLLMIVSSYLNFYSVKSKSILKIKSEYYKNMW
uniref:ATP synthase subunit 8 n=1 Tax=Chrysis horridula TaxID=1906576 RepID=A0A1D9CJG0_9HYME|nr:ATP synthase subunit 8 [Chrysis horridula]